MTTSNLFASLSEASTVTGLPQIQLIKAAVLARVWRFAPAEFEGPPHRRNKNGPLDRERTSAQEWLSHFSEHLQTTTFVCGILYEHFQPGGLASSRIGLTSHLDQGGDFMLNCGKMEARLPYFNADHEASVVVCMTSARDVGRFVAQAIDLPQWPSELRMCGERISIRDLVILVQSLTGRRFDPLIMDGPDSLCAELCSPEAHGNVKEQVRLHALMTTAQGGYDYTDHNLNTLCPNMRPMSFREWFSRAWVTAVP